jgi:hypothetical protein
MVLTKFVVHSASLSLSQNEENVVHEMTFELEGIEKIFIKLRTNVMQMDPSSVVQFDPLTSCTHKKLRCDSRAFMQIIKF